MFTFSIIKKIGEGNYLKEERFILERIRKERALNMDRTRVDTNSNKGRAKNFIKNERFRLS